MLKFIFKFEPRAKYGVKTCTGASLYSQPLRVLAATFQNKSFWFRNSHATFNPVDLPSVVLYYVDIADTISLQIHLYSRTWLLRHQTYRGNVRPPI